MYCHRREVKENNKRRDGNGVEERRCDEKAREGRRGWHKNNRGKNKLTDRQTDRHTDRQTDRQTDTLAKGQRIRHTVKNITEPFYTI